MPNSWSPHSPQEPAKRSSPMARSSTVNQPNMDGSLWHALGSGLKTPLSIHSIDLSSTHSQWHHVRPHVISVLAILILCLWSVSPATPASAYSFILKQITPNYPLNVKTTQPFPGDVANQKTGNLRFFSAHFSQIYTTVPVSIQNLFKSVIKTILIQPFLPHKRCKWFRSHFYSMVLNVTFTISSTLYFWS